MADTVNALQFAWAAKAILKTAGGLGVDILPEYGSPPKKGNRTVLSRPGSSTWKILINRHRPPAAVIDDMVEGLAYVQATEQEAAAVRSMAAVYLEDAMVAIEAAPAVEPEEGAA